MGDDVDAEDGVPDLVDGEAHSVDGDRALARDVAGELRRNFDLQAHGTSFFARGHDSRDAVHVSRHEMAAERISRPERRLEIDGRARDEIPERRERESLPRDIGGEGLAQPLGHRQAAALHADAVAELHPREVEAAAGDGETHIAAARLERARLSDVLNDSGEQGRSRSPSSLKRRPPVPARRAAAAAAAGHRRADASR